MLIRCAHSSQPAKTVKAAATKATEVVSKAVANGKQAVGKAAAAVAEAAESSSDSSDSSDDEEEVRRRPRRSQRVLCR